MPRPQPAQSGLSRVPIGVIWAGGGLALTAAITLGVAFGSTSIPVAEVWWTIWHRLTGEPLAPGTREIIIWQIRFPRPFLAAVVGAGLGIVGTVVQAVVRNPLADPYLLGVSSGASLGAVAVLVTGGGLLATAVGSVFLLPVAAFAGALAAFGAVWLVARRGVGFAPLRLILAGVAIGQMFAAVTSFLVLQADDVNQTHSILFWLMGSLAGAIGPAIPVVGVVVVVGGLVVYAHARALNASVMGDETASALGVDVTRVRTVMFVVAGLMTGTMVAFSGAIGFLGLLVPHLCRFVVGTDHRRLVPTAALAGAVLLCAVDLICRVAVHAVNQELPVNVVTSLIGAPVLLAMLDRRLRPA